ncbi:MAG: glycosyltransferase family 2 protein [Deltaproteobacteria bacterium]|nr:glycosyltransferase family 2 protein [Deltaproteobacteria bacterium]
MTTTLSICIPTYNRVSLLSEALDSILAQAREGLEVVICDNASSDATQELVEEYRQKFGNITYFRWDENMGFDRNILKVIELASGEYCWFFGDDDQLEAGALDHVFPLLNKGFDLIYLNAMSYDSSMRNPSGPTLNSFECGDADSTLLSLASWITFVSSICVRREEFMKHFQVGLAHVGTGFAHCYPLLKLMHGGRCRIVPETLVKFRAGNTGGYNIFKIFIEEFGKIMDYAGNIGFSRDTIFNILTRNVYIVIIPALVQIKLGKLSLKSDNAMHFLSRSGLGVKEKFLLLVLALCPARIIILMKNIKNLK